VSTSISFPINNNPSTEFSKIFSRIFFEQHDEKEKGGHLQQMAKIFPKFYLANCPTHIVLKTGGLGVGDIGGGIGGGYTGRCKEFLPIKKPIYYM
jgi:hypothetical protein